MRSKVVIRFIIRFYTNIDVQNHVKITRVISNGLYLSSGYRTLN